MMSVRKLIRDYLTFSRRDRIGIVVVLAMILLIYFLPILFQAKEATIPIDTGSALSNAIDTLQSGQLPDEQVLERKNTFKNEKSDFIKRQLFDFDPNSLSPEGWKKLGLDNRTINTITRFCNKGGRFYKKEDLQKIWGLPDGFYEHVKDHIIIPSALHQYAEQKYPTTSKTERIIHQIDINSADSLEWMALPGIGNKLATRIIAFREKLGGFFSTEQISEIYGLKDSVFQNIRSYLKISGSVKKININSITRDELKTHPYFKWNLANAIIEYRNQHGNFKSLEELKNISLVDEGTFKKIVNYLEL